MQIIETTKSKVDVNRVLNVQGFKLEKVLEMEPNFLKVCLYMNLSQLLLAQVAIGLRKWHCHGPSLVGLGQQNTPAAVDS